MKKVGIVTTVYGNNYGEALQAFAIRKAINTYCDDCTAEILNFRCDKHKSMKKPGFEYFYESNQEKQKIFQKFRHDEIGITDENPLNDVPAEVAQKFSAFVFGSDQIWNTNAWKVPQFFGSFVPAGKKKVSYAASIGLPPDSALLDTELFEKYIDTFDCISVRESCHCDFLKKFTNKEVHHVIDPTMLLDINIYEKMAEKAEKAAISRNYIFYYQPNSADGAIVSLVNKLARQYGFDVVHTFANIPNEVFPFDSYSMRFKGPYEFLYYIKNASMVITRSYHAAVFSILFKKPFYVYVDKKSGTRFESLMKSLGLEDRLVYEYLKPEEVNFEIDYDKVFEKLHSFKESSLKYLKESLN